ncbi:uncharacterized protein LOC142351868 isoform X2 [Convolutriloba macropyga]|uniref:uncharacterized protein LOC142351868 isoform X2 n=1 Tax=Convolutriloba macropyga TaxID=536237 RepID=UPI003F521EF1
MSQKQQSRCKSQFTFISILLVAYFLDAASAYSRGLRYNDLGHFTSAKRGILDHDMGGKICHEENDKCHFHGDCCEGLACKLTYEGVCLPHNGETIFTFLGKIISRITD